MTSSIQILTKPGLCLLSTETKLFKRASLTQKLQKCITVALAELDARTHGAFKTVLNTKLKKVVFLAIPNPLHRVEGFISTKHSVQPSVL